MPKVCGHTCTNAGRSRRQRSRHRGARRWARLIGKVEACRIALGEPVELGVPNAVFRAHRPAGPPPQVGSVKTDSGPVRLAAGIAGLLEVAPGRRQIPPHRHLEHRAGPSRGTASRRRC